MMKFSHIIFFFFALFFSLMSKAQTCPDINDTSFDSGPTKFYVGIRTDGYRIFATSRLQDEVRAFDMAGNFLFNITGFNEADGIDIAPNGNLYVGDRWNDQVKVFDYDGAYQFSFDRNGNMNGPEGVKIYNGEVYVVERDASVVSVFDLDGTFLRNFTNTNMLWPTGIDIRDGLVYVAEASANHRIDVFDLSGNLLAYVGDASVFNFPNDVAADAEGNIYVAEANNYRVSKFDAAGNFVCYIDEVKQASCIDELDGVLYVGHYAFPTEISIYTLADPDADNDGIPDEEDNCPNDANPGQEDSDTDGYGDACDSDFNIDVIVDNTNDYIEEDLDLTNGQANSLTTKLDDALEKYCDGKETPALNKLNAFKNHVQGLYDDGELSYEEAQNLTDAADAIITAINAGTIECPGQNLVVAPGNSGFLNEAHHMGLTIFPNPTSGNITIRFDAIDAPSRVTIFDIYGKQVWQQKTPTSQDVLQVDLSKLQSGTGMYFVSTSNGDDHQTQRVILSK